MNCSVPSKFTVEILRLNKVIKCSKVEIRMMKVDKDEKLGKGKGG